LRRPRVAIAAAATGAVGAPTFAAAIAACSGIRYAPSDADESDMAEVERAIQDVLSASNTLLLSVVMPSGMRHLTLRHAASSAL
jgi:hypothetical protein